MKHCTHCGASTPDDARFCPGCGAPVAAAGGGDPFLGKVIADRYLLVEKIGQGGSGTIYRAEHTTLHKRVAVKVLHAQLTTDDTALERFRREATTVTELDNEHILQVLDFGRTDDNRQFFAMEYLEGEPLTKVLERHKKLPIPRALDILTQIAEALMEAHGLGYIHRDLRPRNVFLINRRGRADFVKVLDFGLAKLLLPNTEAKHTAMGMTFGDPRYMSPEQARGESLDRRSDIYSLGAIAFEMLTGSPPYIGSGTFEILQQHLDAAVPHVRDERPDCPEWLDALVQRALAKKVEGRFVTVLKMLETMRSQQGLLPADAADKPVPAKSTPVATTLQGPSPLQSMGPTEKPAAIDHLPPQQSSPRQTMALTSLAPRNGGAAKGVIAKKDGDKDKEIKAGGPPGAPAAASGSVEVAPTPLKPPPAAANVPSVVVESSSQEKTIPAKVPAPQVAVPPFDERPTIETPMAAPLPPPPTVEAPRRKADPTGEWFSDDSAPIKLARGASYDEDLDVPRRNRGPIIIMGVAGGLLFVGAVVIALLPKPAHKPVRGETAAAATQPAKPPPPPAATAINPGTPPPTGAPAIAPPPSGVAVAPSGSPPSGATIGAAAKQPPAVAAKEPPPVMAKEPPPVAAKQPPPVTAKEPPVVAVKEPPAAKEPPPPPAKLPVAKVEKPTRVAMAEKPRAEKPRTEKARAEKPAKEPPAEKPRAAEKIAKEPPAEKPAAADKRKAGKSPEGFKDPFAPDAPKATAPAASESAQAEFFVKLGRQKLNSSDLAAAAANFSKAREYDARSAEAVAGLGEVAFEQGDYAGAAVHLKQALRLAPNRSRYLILLGQAYYKLGKPKDAVVEYKKALRLDPNNREAQHSLEIAERKLQSGG
jgi:serine/threonine-protein kinase